MIWELYVNQTASIIIDDELSEPAEIGRGARQGGLLSTIIYSIYAEFMLVEALEGNQDGINVGGEVICADRYAQMNRRWSQPLMSGYNV